MHCFVSPAKRLRERATMLRYIYSACLVLFHQISPKMTKSKHVPRGNVTSYLIIIIPVLTAFKYYFT